MKAKQLACPCATITRPTQATVLPAGAGKLKFQLGPEPMTFAAAELADGDE